MSIPNKLMVEKLFRDAEAVITGNHFVYKSGKHGPAYVNKDALLRVPLIADTLASGLATWASSAFSSQVEVVLGPAVAGAILAHQVATHLNRRRPCLSAYADKDGEGFILKRGFENLIPGRRVLLIEDIVNTGDSLKKVIECVRSYDGRILGVGALCNRGEETAGSLGVPVFDALLKIQMKVYEAKDCPLCKEGIPINQSLGHGRKFSGEFGDAS